MSIQELEQQMHIILNNGLIKNIENPFLKTKITTALLLKRVLKLGWICSEIIQDIKFRGGTTSLKEKFSKTYVKLFAQLPAPKDEIINHLIFVLTYNIHWLLWKNPTYKDSVNMRFVYDCYHIMIFYSNGLYVSDAYIKGQIEKIFTSKFLEYERIKDQILLQKKLEQKRKQQDRQFLGKKVLFPSLASDEGLRFAKDLNEKFKPPRLVRKESMKIEKFDESSTQLPAQTKYLLSHLQLNVNQVSPSVKQVLHMNKGQVPFSRAKLLQHNFEKADEKLQLAGLLNNAPQEKQKVELKVQQNIIDTFDLRAPGKEYYQKFDKVDSLFKEMLDLNYVLMNHQESMYSLYSTKELGKQIHFPNLSEDNSKREKQTHASMFLEPVSESDPQQQQQQQQQQSIATSVLDNNEQSMDFKGGNIKQPPIYEGKQKIYKKKYDKIIQSESTDARIDDLIHNLVVKQHLVSNHHHTKHKK